LHTHVSELHIITFVQPIKDTLTKSVIRPEVGIDLGFQPPF
jgi:hypothetical protein